MPKHHKITRIKEQQVNGQEKNKQKNSDFDRSWLRESWLAESAQKSEDVKKKCSGKIWSWAERIGPVVPEESGGGSVKV